MGDVTGAKAADPDLLFQQLIALVFEIPKQEIPDLPSQIGAALNSSAVQDQIRTALMNFTLDTGKMPGFSSLSEAEQKKLFNAMLSKSAPAFEQQIQKSFTNSPQYKQIANKFNELKVALKQSPLGIWIDKEKSLLIVIGVVVAAGGAAALFYTKTGGPVVDLPISQIKGKVIPLWSIGSFKLGAKLLQFQPAQRKIGIEVVGEQKWNKLDVTVGFGVLATGASVTQLNGEATIATTDAFKIKTDGTYALQDKKATLGVGIVVGKDKVDLSVHAILTGDKFTGGSLTGKVNFNNFSVGLTGQQDGKETKGMALLTIPF